MTQPARSSPFESTPFDMPPPRRRLPAAPEAPGEHRLFFGLLAIAGTAAAMLVGLSLP